MNNIPITAWEQAAIVVLFAIFVLALLYLAYKIAKDVSTSFQEFIKARDTEWQAYFDRIHAEEEQSRKDREEAFSDRNSAVVKAMSELAKLVTGLDSTIKDQSAFNIAHHNLMQQAIQDMRSIVLWRYGPPKEPERKD